MTFRIALSAVKALGFDFDQAVSEFVQAKRDHTKTVGKAAPTAPHAFVEAAVRRVPGEIVDKVTSPDNFLADYEVIDDTPPPLTLDEKKAELARNASHEAMVLIGTVIHPLKARSLQYQVGDASGVPETERTEAHKAVLADYDNRMKKQDKIWRHLAEVESQIADLTADQVDVWKAPPFPSI